MCLLSTSGLPTLRGGVFTRLNSEIGGYLNSLLDEVNSTVALIRHDKHPEAPGHPRGGFLVGRELLQEVIEFFFDQDRIVAVYEMADPLLNGHNLSLLFESNSEVWIEVVGPGFDASDLQRGDVSPHETFSVRLSAEREIAELILSQRIDQKDYEESVRIRRSKIKTKLASSPTPELAWRIRENLAIPDDVDAHLERIDSPLCRLQTYRPIPETLVQDTIRRIIESRVIERYCAETGAQFPLVISTSLVNRGSKQVFWDIVSPALKFERLGRFIE